MDALAEGLAAGVGGVVSASLLYPMELVKNKLQCQQEGDAVTDRNMVSCAKRVVAESGAGGLFRGVEWSASSSFVEKSL